MSNSFGIAMKARQEPLQRLLVAADELPAGALKDALCVLCDRLTTAELVELTDTLIRIRFEGGRKNGRS